jgi:hypothetical protein
MNELSFVNRRFSRFMLDSLLEQAIDAAREEEFEEFEAELEFEGVEA